MRKLLLIFLFISLVDPLSAKAFHLLLIGDTEDALIGTAASKSLQNLEQSFSYISKVSGIPLQITKLTSTESTFTYKNVRRWVSKAKVERDDIIVLFYEGHGGRWQSSPTIWPSGCFPDCILGDFSLVIKKLLSKKAALYLVIIDSCNEFIDKNDQPNCPRNWFNSKAYFELKGMNDSLVAAGCRELFSKPYGLLIANATLPGTVAYVNPEREDRVDYNDGYSQIVGFPFTNIFLNNLFRELQTPAPKWKQIFKRAQAETIEESKDSRYPSFFTPQYRIFQHKHRKKPSVYKKHFLEECAYHKHSLLGKALDGVIDSQAPCSCFFGKSIDEFEEAAEAPEVIE